MLSQTNKSPVKPRYTTLTAPATPIQKVRWAALNYTARLSRAGLPSTLPQKKEKNNLRRQPGLLQSSRTALGQPSQLHSEILS